jgi:hypothetical protein
MISRKEERFFMDADGVAQAALYKHTSLQNVGVTVVNIEYSLGRGQTNMAAKIFKKLSLTWLKVTTQHERFSTPIMIFCGIVG